ncbi:MAG: hypothetical protein ABEJ99_02380 [Candidatus Nanohaloarchaea archaeon]
MEEQTRSKELQRFNSGTLEEDWTDVYERNSVSPELTEEEEEEVPRIDIPEQLMPEDYERPLEESWQDVYERNMVELRFDEEDVEDDEPDFSDQVLAYQHDQEFVSPRQAALDGYRISRELSFHYDRTNEYWILQATEKGLEPVLKVDDDSLEIIPEFDPAKEITGSGNDSEKDHFLHPVDIVEDSGYFDDLSPQLMNYSVSVLDSVPVLETNSRFSATRGPATGEIYAPGLEEGYLEVLNRLSDH